MKKLFRYTAYITGSIFVILMLIWGGTLIYISKNKKDILTRIQTEAHKRLNADIAVGDVDLSFFRTFPVVSLRFSEVVLRDSLWEKHHHDLFQAKNVYAGIRLSSLFTGKLRFKRIIVDEASLYLYTDSTGYRSQDIFRKKAERSAEVTPLEIPGILLKNIDLTVDRRDKKKLFHFSVKKLDVDPHEKENSVQLNTDLSVFVHELTFNETHGSFLKEKEVSGKFIVNYHPGGKVLDFENINLQIGGNRFSLDGKFFVDVVPLPFLLKVRCNAISYTDAAELLSPHIQAALKKYATTGKLKIDAILDGTNTDFRDPVITLKADATNNNLTTPVGIFSNASFWGKFQNRINKQLPPGDPNSSLVFSDFSATWQQIPLSSKNISITDLKDPQLACDLSTGFDLSLLNNLSGSNTLQFEQGRGTVQVEFKTPLGESDSAESSINGTAKIDSASFSYLPRQFHLTECSGLIRFSDVDVHIDQLQGKSGKSQLKMDGSISNFLKLLIRNPDKLTLNWNIFSPKLYLEDFTSFIGTAQGSSVKKEKHAEFGKAASQMDKMWRESGVHLRLQATEIQYKKFSGSELNAAVSLLGPDIDLEKIALRHDGGNILLSGKLIHNGKENPVELNANLVQVDIPKIFAGFNNFGQDALLDKNLQGKINADIQLHGLLTDKATFVQDNMKGTIDFDIRDGELINFEPMIKISQSAFKGRDFSHIHFARLKDRISIDGNQLQFSQMEIQSNVMSMIVEGIYDLKKGTDMSIRFPVSNLKTKKVSDSTADPALYGKSGISLRLRAKTGDDGKLKITWDPFKRALKQMKKNANKN